MYVRLNVQASGNKTSHHLETCDVLCHRRVVILREEGHVDIILDDGTSFGDSQLFLHFLRYLRIIRLINKGKLHNHDSVYSHKYSS